MDLYDADGNLVSSDESATERMAQLPRKVVRRLEKEAEEGRVAKAENEQLKRERAFVQAGIDLSDKRAAYFIAGYQGEQTPAAIRQEWKELYGGSSGNSPDPQIQNELMQQQMAQNLVNGQGSLEPDVLAKRDAELAAISQTDPLAPQKFDQIMSKYGGVYGDMHS